VQRLSDSALRFGLHTDKFRCMRSLAPLCVSILGLVIVHCTSSNEQTDPAKSSDGGDMIDAGKDDSGNIAGDASPNPADGSVDATLADPALDQPVDALLNATPPNTWVELPDSKMEDECPTTVLARLRRAFARSHTCPLTRLLDSRLGIECARDVGAHKGCIVHKTEPLLQRVVTIGNRFLGASLQLRLRSWLGVFAPKERGWDLGGIKRFRAQSFFAAVGADELETFALEAKNFHGAVAGID
jgi:hypothetical protein